MYGWDQVLPAHRHGRELQNPHPILKAFQQERYSQVFNRTGARERVIPAYMGLIKQIDDQIGLLMSFMESEGLFDRTLVIFTSDHGDYLGDHWLGERYLFHNESVRVPLIIADPSAQADRTRGETSRSLVESIDLIPTIIEYLGGRIPSHILEGRSLMPILSGRAIDTGRKYVISEYDYSFDSARAALKVPIPEARLYMVYDGCFKYIHADGFAPMLYDLQSDPDEFIDLGDHPQYRSTRDRLYGILSKWSRTTRTQTTVSDEAIQSADEASRAYDLGLDAGILIGYWDEEELSEEHRKRQEYLSEKSKVP
jgi:arylsulfatase A-like enzyme